MKNRVPCIAGHVGTGGLAGGGGGAVVGLIGGPFAEITVPVGSLGGMLGGGAVGLASGINSCATPGGPAFSTGGGGNSGAPKNLQENADYNHAVKDVESRLGVDTRNLSSYDLDRLNTILRNVHDEITGRALPMKDIEDILYDKVARWWGEIRARAI